MSIQTNIQAQVDSYSPSVRRIADAILSRPQIVLELTITELARSCETSETSVVRFCQTLGLKGYGPLKLQMAAELATEAAQRGGEGPYGSDILASDDLATMVAKISSSELLGIQETASHLDLDALQTIVDAALAAPRIAIFGMASSNPCALDLAEKLQRIGRVALCSPDSHHALSAAALLAEGDVAIGFSHSGSTRETTEFLHVARGAGALTVAVTNVPGSPIAERADVVLHTAVRETTFRSGAMASRIAQFTIVDYIFVGVARMDYENSIRALRLTRESLRGLKS